ncbi:MAG: hypothetical protein AWU58_2005, partial [Methanohalophilus sp. T328-1]
TLNNSNYVKMLLSKQDCTKNKGRSDKDITLLVFDVVYVSYTTQ